MEHLRIVDGCAMYGPDPSGRSGGTLEDLQRIMDRHCVEIACVHFQQAARMDPRRGNDEVLEQIRDNPRFRPVAALDPRHIESGASEVDRCAKAGVRLFRLFPELHGYPWGSMALMEVWETLARSNVALIVPQGGAGFLSEFLAATRDYPFAKLLIGCQYWIYTEYLAGLRRYPETFLMAVAANYAGFYETLVEEVGAHRLCFGTNAPMYYVGASLMVLQHAQISEQDRAQILGGTLLRLLGENL
ncbi:MAG TPA: amidohydrolase family protein [bacterium]|nr:amidohydrolase family protein [bacterium]HQL60886.1 amidohydrolase family protein [bacterium]